MLIWSGAELISLSVLFMLLFAAANKDHQDANDVAPKKSFQKWSDLHGLFKYSFSGLLRIRWRLLSCEIDGW